MKLKRFKQTIKYLHEELKKKIQEQAKEKMSEGGGDKKSNNYKNRVSPNEEKRSDTKIHTDKELAKMAGVGTVARYNNVMNLNDKMLNI